MAALEPGHGQWRKFGASGSLTLISTARSNFGTRTRAPRSKIQSGELTMDLLTIVGSVTEVGTMSQSAFCSQARKPILHYCRPTAPTLKALEKRTKFILVIKST
jgi:hypothetical protein